MVGASLPDGFADPSLPDGWTQLVDSKNRTYYSNHHTRENNLEAPSACDRPTPPPTAASSGQLSNPVEQPSSERLHSSSAFAVGGEVYQHETYPAAATHAQVAAQPQYFDGGGEQQQVPPPPAYGDEKDLEDPVLRQPPMVPSGAPARRGGAAVEGRAPMTGVAAGPAGGAAGVVGEASAGLVLPCAPSDVEKISYQRSGRFFLLFFAFFSIYYTCGAMVLFTISSPYFYFFGVRTVFAIVYLTCHYCGVSVWGKDFQPTLHHIALRQATAQGYLPTVDVFLPVCSEPTVLLANSWSFVRKLDYPSTHLAVHVLDDGASDEVRDLARAHGFQYIRRADSPAMRKSGNLRHAFSVTTGEAFVVFDADFCPRPDFLRETVPHLTDPSIGILQTPQYFSRRPHQTWVEQGAGVCQELFYRMEQVNLDRFNAALCAGSCAVYRRSAVESFGGVANISHSEDMFTGFEMMQRGRFKVKYLPLCLATGTCPHDQRSFFMQQYRWCSGILALVGQGGFWGSNISDMHKLCFFNGLLYYLAPALFIFFGPLPLLLLVWLKPGGVLWTYVGLAVPPLFFGCVVLPCWAKQDGFFRQLSAHRVRVIRSYAHLYAIKDHLTGAVAPWVPSGGVSRATSRAHSSSTVVLVLWSSLSTAGILAGAIWSILGGHEWYHFVFPVGVALSSCALNLSTLQF